MVWLIKKKNSEMQALELRKLQCTLFLYFIPMLGPWTGYGGLPNLIFFA